MADNDNNTKENEDGIFYAFVAVLKLIRDLICILPAVVGILICVIAFAVLFFGILLFITLFVCIAVIGVAIIGISIFVNFSLTSDKGKKQITGLFKKQ
jgi:uncharacterized membrane protein